jgi:CDP-paratose 2-epimerase
MSTRILVTGGAGFVGSQLALAWKRDNSECEVVALDNLKRRGSELTLSRLAQGGVDFCHGDVRRIEDIESIGDVDILIECSAEPSVQAGYDGDARYLIDTNLSGTVNCLEHARQTGAGLVFLSTSRVYPIAGMRALPLVEEGDRLVLPDDARGTGWTQQGISLDFPLGGPRSLYGTTKLCSELLIQEYAAMYQVPSVILRCGVLSGPWQMGREDQGFVALWAARHRYGGDLEYRGFGGRGLQVRDVLHIDDLYDLVALQVARLSECAGDVFVAGGGAACSVSLRELTALCGRLCGNPQKPGSTPETHPSDVPWFITDNRVTTEKTGWRPRRSLEHLLDDLFSWLGNHRAELEPYFVRPSR